MKISDTVDLAKVLAAHAEWARDYYGSKGASLSDERRADLSRAYLSGAYLSRANLSGANLSGADLSRADLSRADLSRADLSRAYLSGAYLSGANLSGANLSGADLSRADLSGANLSGADLSRADLSGANLSGADLSRANLSGAGGFNADEHRAAFWIVPEVGAFVGWKKLKGGVIAQVEIPAKSKRTSSIQGRKCRAEYVKTLALFQDGKKVAGTHQGIHDNGNGGAKYAVGKITRADKYDESPLVECSGGIHFFVTQQEAVAYA